MMKASISNTTFQDLLSAVINLNKQMTMVVNKNGVIFQSTDPTNMAIVRVEVPAEKFESYESQLDNWTFLVDIGDIYQDVQKGTVNGDIHLQVNEKKITVKTRFFTSEYPISKPPTPIFNNFVATCGQTIRIPDQIYDYIKVLLNRKIEKVIIQHSKETLTLFGENAQKYSLEIKVPKNTVDMGTTTVSVLWLNDILTSLRTQDIDMRFSSFGNLHLLSSCEYGDVHAVLSGTVRKLQIPQDIPRIDTPVGEVKGSMGEFI